MSKENIQISLPLKSSHIVITFLMIVSFYLFWCLFTTSLDLTQERGYSRKNEFEYNRIKFEYDKLWKENLKLIGDYEKLKFPEKYKYLIEEGE